jgi:hypothetical protein
MRTSGSLREAPGRTAALTHWSFSHVRLSPAHRDYLRTRRATIASDAINDDGLRRVQREQHQLFVEDTAPRTVHAMTSPRYARVQSGTPFKYCDRPDTSRRTPSVSSPSAFEAWSGRG